MGVKLRVMSLGVLGLEFGVQGCRVQGVGFMASGSVFRAQQVLSTSLG